MDYLKSIQHTETRDNLKQSWKDITKKAEDEARQLSLSLKESRENKLHMYTTNEAERQVKQTYQSTNSPREKISGTLVTTNHQPILHVKTPETQFSSSRPWVTSSNNIKDKQIQKTWIHAQTKRKWTSTRKRLSQEDATSKWTLKKRNIYRKNRLIQNSNTGHL